ncbi:mandelate racemase/muconate lactonizing enzyme family protein [Alicyclobacillus macrosporangiidus]|uniref:mandelate racemase/muconate lactonizing enzyme family protein n=1 Tax=Alicyclobacillus macrosporangiidus TaxID=392015 RepID=UPI000496D406|nr:mandelate racemase/muconate lactonizing enzyme family protein [Alicyclobacillus macrosporangiidus]
MKITAVEVVKLSFPVDPPMADAIHFMPERNLVLVQIHTDEGTTGIGEAACYGGPMESTEAVIRHELAPRLIGEDPFRVEYLWRKMAIPSHQHGRGGILYMAISGIDIALYDIIGKATKTPLYKLLGGYRDEVEAYASAGFYAADKTPDDLAAECAGYVDRGFRHVKIKVGRNRDVMLNPLHNTPMSDYAAVTLEEDLERVRRVREAVGPRVRIAVDANNAWTPSIAIQMGRALERFGIHWFEEPVDTDDLDGSAQVAAALDVPVAGYETCFSLPQFRELILRRAVDIVQPDVIWSGGFTESRKVAALAHAFHLPVIPHVFSSGLSLVANLHFIASIPNGGLIEFDQNRNDLRTLLFEEPLDIDARGYVRVPNRPGLGVTLNQATVDKYRVP